MQKYEASTPSEYTDYNDMDTISSTDDDRRAISKTLNFYCKDTKNDSHYVSKNQSLNLNCKICNESNDNKGNYIILSCNHIFHVRCLTESHFDDVNKYTIISDDYFSTRTCHFCANQLQIEEVLFLHSKYLKSTKCNYESHQAKITMLEERLANLKEDLRVCYDYKQKLEHDREKSKQIVATLMTMM